MIDPTQNADAAIKYDSTVKTPGAVGRILPRGGPLQPDNERQLLAPTTGSTVRRFPESAAADNFASA
ncbi:MAG TPA: hypothetical protein VEL28_03765 [Candidatus Binatia bacterium]|nr:hypothetical protein [Candidatus Binatia bacterium]